MASQGLYVLSRELLYISALHMQVPHHQQIEPSVWNLELHSKWANENKQTIIITLSSTKENNNNNNTVIKHCGGK